MILQKSAAHTQKGEVQLFETSEVKLRRVLKAAAVTQRQHGPSENISTNTTRLKEGRIHRRAFKSCTFLNIPLNLSNAIPQNAPGGKF